MVSGTMGVGRDGKGGDQGSSSQFGTIQQLLFPEKHKQELLCTLVRDPIVNAEYN